ncbi:MAG: DUF1653 domain-containing protein [Clostridiales bacterium]|nr:DUF1653 domain-containing protein [Clostridiales bacterium]
MSSKKILEQSTGRVLELKNIYRHYKGNYYYVEDIAINSETEEIMVIYFSLYNDEEGNRMMFTQPIKRFLEQLNPEVYDTTIQETRFEKVEFLSFKRNK